MLGERFQIDSWQTIAGGIDETHGICFIAEEWMPFGEGLGEEGHVRPAGQEMR